MKAILSENHLGSFENACQDLQYFTADKRSTISWDIPHSEASRSEHNKSIKQVFSVYPNTRKLININYSNIIRLFGRNLQNYSLFELSKKLIRNPSLCETSFHRDDLSKLSHDVPF